METTSKSLPLGTNNLEHKQKTDFYKLPHSTLVAILKLKMKLNIKLNSAQQQAVNQIEGPVLVLAGPGTGKTQLLSSRVANILNLTDVGPSNILCLTYTEAGVSAMRQRLAKTIGAGGYQVSVHTFHSFALEVMRRFPDYFLDTGGFSPIDDLTSYQILESILAELPPNFKLAHRSFAKENRISELVDKISELKKNGLTPKKAQQLANKNQQELNSLQQILSLIPAEIPRAKAKITELIQNIINYLQSQNLEEDSADYAIPPLKNIILKELTEAAALSLESGKSTPITNFKNNHLQKDSKGNWIFKDSRYNQNLQEVAYIYKEYEHQLGILEKLEFNDMILNLITAMQNYPELKLNIQEQWQYILVDEFQDTSLAQLEIIKLLTKGSTHSEQPNIMLVGDDDQAIYAFQGASVSNIQTFLELFPNTKIITLTENYRSSQTILAASTETAKQIQERPAGTKLKVLQPQNTEVQNLEVEVTELTDLQAELNWLCQDIKTQINNGTKPENIAVLAPKHKFLQELAPEMNSHHIPVFYETSTNILEDQIIQELLSLSQLVLQIGAGELAHSNANLAQVLSSPYWGLEPGSVWRLAIFASKSEPKNHWLEHLQNGALGEAGIQIYNQLTFWGAQSNNLSLEQMLDLIIGVSSPPSLQPTNPLSGEVLETEEGGIITYKISKEEKALAISPFKQYYFSNTKLKSDPARYANFLASLSSLRDHLRSYYPNQSAPKLKDLLTYTELCQAHGGIRLARRGLHIKPSGVNLLTAYGSKGLEFEQVYLIHCLEDVWSESARGRSDTLKFTANFSGHRDSSDDKTRLFYVAQTRAKSRLICTLYKFDEKGKPKTALRYLEPLKTLPGIKLNNLAESSITAEDAAEIYQQKLFTLAPSPLQGEGVNEADNSRLANILQPLLENYRLSPTHLNTWLDPEYGGKEEFITRHLLRFPQAMNESAVHGSAVHKALEKAHTQFNHPLDDSQKEKGGSSKKNKNLEDLLISTYQHEVSKSSLDSETKSHMLKKAEFLFKNLLVDILSLIKTKALSEVDIKANFEEVKLSGKLDAIIINSAEGSAIIRDYKTGKPKQKIEERYKHQLYFYKLLLDLSGTLALVGRGQGEGSKKLQLKGAELVYLRPSEDSVVTLSLEYQEDEYQQFKKLIKKTWSEIMHLGSG